MGADGQGLASLRAWVGGSSIPSRTPSRALQSPESSARLAAQQRTA
jgi:hypothetical protein